MSDKPILFTSPMVNAIIAGNKTLTSRSKCNFKIGDVLWVKEKWGVQHAFDDCKPSEIIQRAAALNFQKAPKVYYSADNSLGGDHGLGGLITRPSLFMCRWMSRITLEVTELFKYNLQGLTDEMAIDEGAVYDPDKELYGFKDLLCVTSSREPRVAYMLLLMHMKIIDSFNDAPDLFGVRFKVLEIKQ
jgi:hypothetical protein